MQKSSDTRGFTLVEVVVAMALIAVLIAIALPNLTSYQLRQDARGRTQQIADALSGARANAIREGNQYFILFHRPTTGSLTIVDDDNNNWQQDPGEGTTVIDRSIWTNARVTPYGELASPPAATPVLEDFAGGGTIPVSPPGAVGTTFPIDPWTNTAAVGFNSRGVPVDLNNDTVWGSGQGSFYITDNETSVYAVTLLPLGAIRLRAYSSAGWY
ncbi:MAG: prepilin-type N-terminal cleavage/methylation domain-containing protein [Myxococcales bacterium]|nr:prepilin-type N-terminal cleavage/methylation domain-containing protein [Myxococcales bacterium]